jgi:hypothetical protein
VELPAAVGGLEARAGARRGQLRRTINSRRSSRTSTSARPKVPRSGSAANVFVSGGRSRAATTSARRSSKAPTRCASSRKRSSAPWSR